MRSSCFFVFICICLSARAIAQSPTPTPTPEFDPAAVSPVFDYSTVPPNPDTVPLLRGTAYYPSGLAVGGTFYLYVTENFVINTPSEPTPVDQCPGVTEQTVVYSVPDGPSVLTQDYPRLNTVSPCFGDEQTFFNTTGKAVAYGATVVQAGNGIEYIAVNRAEGAQWSDGDFDKIYLGGAASPTLFAYKLSPILQKFTLGGITYELLQPVLAPSLTDPNMLWGYVPFGGMNDPGGATMTAAIKLIVNPSEIRPKSVQVYLKSGGNWVLVPDGGGINFLPDDQNVGFNISSLYYNSARSRFELWGYLGITPKPGTGCLDSDSTPGSAEAYRTLQETTVTQPGTGTLGPINTLIPTDNGRLGRVWSTVHRLPDGREALFYGSTDHACVTRHTLWLKTFSPFLGCEIVFRTLDASRP